MRVFLVSGSIVLKKGLAVVVVHVCVKPEFCGGERKHFTFLALTQTHALTQPNTTTNTTQPQPTNKQDTQPLINQPDYTYNRVTPTPTPTPTADIGFLVGGSVGESNRDLREKSTQWAKIH